MFNKPGKKVVMNKSGLRSRIPDNLQEIQLWFRDQQVKIVFDNAEEVHMLNGLEKR